MHASVQHGHGERAHPFYGRCGVRRNGVRTTGACEWVDDTDFGSIPVVTVTGESGHPGTGRALRAPRIGEHTDEILEMLGLSAAVPTPGK